MSKFGHGASVVVHIPVVIVVPLFERDTARLSDAVSLKYVSLVVVAAYVCGLLMVHWQTHDVRQFMLMFLEYGFILLALAARFLFPLLPRDVRLVAASKRVSSRKRQTKIGLHHAA